MFGRLRRVWAMCLAGALVACGGGGGGGDSGPPPNSIALDRANVQLLLGTTDRNVSQLDVVVTFRGAGVVVAALPGQAVPPWLFATAGAASGNTVRISISAVDTTGLAPGSYATTLRFATGNADLSGVVTQDLPVTLKIAPRVAPAALNADAATGGAPTVQTVAVDTPNNWTVRADQPWITLNRAQGAGPGSVAVSMTPGVLAAGEYSGSVTVEDALSGATQILPVRLAVDSRRLLVRKPALALSTYANRATLSGSVAVVDTGNGATRWSATVDQPWLTLVRATGLTPDALALTANPTGLPEGLHLARVTLTPSNEPGVTNSVVVRVSLRVDRSRVVQPMVELARGELTCFGPRLADPLRNLVYAGCGATLHVQDLDSAALVNSIDLPGANLVSLAVSGDGSTLFGVDTAQGRIVRVDLDALAQLSPIAGVRTTFGTTLAWTEVQGVPVLATGELELFNAETGVRLADVASLYSRTCCGLKLAARRDGRALYAMNTTRGNHDLARFSLAWRSGALQVRLTHIQTESGDGNGLALDSTDSNLLTAFGVVTLPSGENIGARLRDPDTLEQRSTYPMVAGVGGADIVGFEGGRTWVMYDRGPLVGFDASGLQISSYTFGDSLSFAVLSADGQRMMVMAVGAANGYLRFIDRP